MGYPHFSGDCGEYHDRIVDWQRNPREPLECPVGNGAHHSYAKLSEQLGVEYWQCKAPVGDPADDRECGARFERKADDTFIPLGVVTLCGSSRFFKEYQAEYYRLTMEGWIVLSIGFYPHSSAEHGHGEGVGHDSAQKIILDQLHLRKIDMSDRVHVINVGGYIGASTKNEIKYAHKRHRELTFMEGVE